MLKFFELDGSSNELTVIGTNRECLETIMRKLISDGSFSDADIRVIETDGETIRREWSEAANVEAGDIEATMMDVDTLFAGGHIIRVRIEDGYIDLDPVDNDLQSVPARFTLD